MLLDAWRNRRGPRLEPVTGAKLNELLGRVFGEGDQLCCRLGAQRRGDNGTRLTRNQLCPAGAHYGPVAAPQEVVGKGWHGINEVAQPPSCLWAIAAQRV